MINELVVTRYSFTKEAEDNSATAVDLGALGLDGRAVSVAPPSESKSSRTCKGSKVTFSSDEPSDESGQSNFKPGGETDSDSGSEREEAVVAETTSTKGKKGKPATSSSVPKAGPIVSSRCM